MASSGYPTANFTTEDEVQWAIRRRASARDSQYQDTTCGPNPFTYDPQGAYLCGGRRYGTSAACNKLEGHECLIRIKPVGDPHHFSCAMYEVENAGDPGSVRAGWQVQRQAYRGG